MMKRLFLLSLLAALFTGCATVEPYDYSLLNESKPRSILVLPPLNESVDVNASYIFLSTISKPLAEKGYYVLPVAVIDAFLKENGLPGPEEMHQVPLEKLRENTGADAVFFVTINNWGQKYQVISSTTTVDASARLVDMRSGEQLWHTDIKLSQGSSDGGGGLAGAIVGALVEQIVDSKFDQTKPVSLQASTNAINNKKRGLLPGPYFQLEQ